MAVIGNRVKMQFEFQHKVTTFNSFSSVDRSQQEGHARESADSMYKRETGVNGVYLKGVTL